MYLRVNARIVLEVVCHDGHLHIGLRFMPSSSIWSNKSSLIVRRRTLRSFPRYLILSGGSSRRRFIDDPFWVDDRRL